MGIFPDMETKKRNFDIKEPATKTLAWGLVLAAAGTVCIAYLFEKTDEDNNLKLVLPVIGVILCIIGIVLFIKYSRDCRKFRDFVPYWDKSRGMYDVYAKELNEWNTTGKYPSCCDGDTAYFLKLQENRLKNKGLTMKSTVLPLKSGSFGTATTPKKSNWYTTDISCENVTRDVSFEDQTGVLYRKTTGENMYTAIVHSPNEAETNNIMVTCPNCGAVSPVGRLMTGCSYCGTQFKISDLFPRVVGNYYVRANSTTKNKSIYRNTILITMGIVAAGVVIAFPIINKGSFSLAQALLTAYIAAALPGGFLGLILGNIFAVSSAVDNGGRKRIPFFASASAKAELTRLNKHFDPYFSYEKFQGQLESLIKMSVYADNRSALACYVPDSADPRFDDIVDMTCCKALVVKSNYLQNHIFHLSLRTWWINHCYENGKIRTHGDCIDVVLERDISEIERPGFSITSVSCERCGGSFDAVRQNVCPYCGTKYHMEYFDWVIEEMTLLR